MKYEYTHARTHMHNKYTHLPVAVAWFATKITQVQLVNIKGM